MPDVQLQPHPQGSRPPPPRDFGRASWSDVGREAWRNAGTSAANFVYGTPFGLAQAGIHAAKQRLGMAPVQPGFNRLAVQGVTDPYMLSDISDTGKQLRGWLGKNFGSPELAMQTAKRAFAADPVGTVGTAVGGAHLLAGGAEALAGAPGIRSTPILRAPIRGVGNVARTVGSPVASTVRAVRGAGPLLADGTLHPSVKPTLDGVAKGSAAEMDANPQFRQRVISTMQRKGVTPQAAREAIVAHSLPPGAAVPRSATTGIHPPPSPPQAPGKASLPTPADIDAATKQAALRASGQQIAQGPGLALKEFATDPVTGKLVGSTQDARDATLAPATAGALKGVDASDARLATHAQDILTAPTNPSTKVQWGPAVRQMVGGLGGAALGIAGAAGAMPHLIGDAAGQLGGAALDLGIGALTGTGAGLGEGRFIEPVMSRLEAQQAKWGAPAQGGPVVSGLARAAPVLDPTIGVLGAGQLALGQHPAAAIAPPTEDDTKDMPDAYKPGQGVPDNSPPTTPLQAPAPQPVPTAPAAAPPAPEAAPAPRAAHGHDVELVPDEGIADAWKPSAPAPQADGGRVGYAVGGQVADMTEHLLRRADAAQKAARSATRPLLGLSDDTVAAALRVAQRGL